MNAKELYEKLDKDFELNKCRDEWKLDFNKFVCENFKKRHMGLFLDNSENIERVFTAVFPSDHVLKKVLKHKNSLLVLHHPMVWDLRKPKAFTDINPKFLPKLKERCISVYVLHVPLDKNGKYSTSVNLAKALGVDLFDEFFDYYGVRVGVIGKTKCKTVQELSKQLSLAVGHKVKAYEYGSDKILSNKVALVGGGGNEPKTYDELAKLMVNTFITGITVLNDHSKEAHAMAKKCKINIIGGTHYSTEKFACISLCNYFKKLGLPCEFIEDEPCMEDL